MFLESLSTLEFSVELGLDDLAEDLAINPLVLQELILTDLAQA